MKKLAVITAVLLASVTMSYAQDCESLVKACEVHLKGKNNSFVSDGQVYTAFLDREKAEFKTTFFGGSTYRIAATAG
ncbi:MAG: hypothetical protein HYZ43_10415, partial [Flavobacteriia bacterium]|nr:hypothetical protein [Flavobacteriia bacterium]